MLGSAPQGAVRAQSHTLDRVVASVDYQAITDSDVDSEYRLEQFFDGKPPTAPPDAETREAVRDRLIDQVLLTQEAEKPDVKYSPEETPAQSLEDVQKLFGSETAFKAAMNAVGMTREQILQKLDTRQKILSLINHRLGPEAVVERAEIEKYYNEKFLPEFKKQNDGTPPALREVARSIREILVQQKVNDLLEDWLRDLRSGHRVQTYGN